MSEEVRIYKKEDFYCVFCEKFFRNTMQVRVYSDNVIMNVCVHCYLNHYQNKNKKDELNQENIIACIPHHDVIKADKYYCIDCGKFIA